MPLDAEKGNLSVKDIYREVVKELNSNKHSNARDLLERLPKEVIWNSPILLNALGIANRGLGFPLLSIRCYLRALKIEQASATWANLGNAYKDANLIDSAIRAHRESIDQSEVSSATQWHNYGLALSISGQNRAAIDAFEKSLALDPDQLAVRWDLARSQLHEKDLVNGFSNYQYRWNMKDAPPKRVIGREWSGQTIKKHESLFVYVEQGFGDYIHCARYLSFLHKKVKNLVVEVKPELLDIMLATYPKINFVAYQSLIKNVETDWIVSLLDLPRYFSDKHFVNSDGYLNVPNKSSESILEILNQYNNLKNIGIVWSGSVTFKRNQFRSTTADKFVDSFNLPGVQLHSLQIGPMANEGQKYSKELLSLDLVSQINSFSDTAQIVKRLDLVISTCTSMVHLCGALGVPCWVLLDYSPHWLWGTQGQKTEWYESLRLFRQPSPGDWRTVFDEATVALLDWTQS